MREAVPHRSNSCISVPKSTAACHYLSVLNKELQRHLNLPVTLTGRNCSTVTRALLDSGASTIFINSTFVRTHNVTLSRLHQPIPLRNADGSQNTIGLITHKAQLLMRIGNHEETIIASVVDTGEDDLILGIDWLRTHNPEIDWHQGHVHFSRCLN